MEGLHLEVTGARNLKYNSGATQALNVETRVHLTSTQYALYIDTGAA